MALEDRLEGGRVTRRRALGQRPVVRHPWRLHSHPGSGVRRIAPETRALDSNIRRLDPSVGGQRSRRTDMRVRLGLLALTLCALLIAVPAASAQEPAPMTKVLS